MIQGMARRRCGFGRVVGGIALLLSLSVPGRIVAADPYLDYVRNAPEFKPVKQDPSVLIGRWNTWLYMPWRAQWTIGTGKDGGEFCRAYGINGGFTDHGGGPLDWLERWHLRFYNDHTADKGYLYLHGANDRRNFVKFQHDPRAVRQSSDGPHPIDSAERAKVEHIITRNIGRLKHSPVRVAYALDDEISWGVFVTPMPWRLNDDEAAYRRWLARYYGKAPPEPQYVTPDFILPQLGRRLRYLDFSPLLDRITYQDSVWANYLGELVECANRADPVTPCGFVGGQAPSTWGGYDYAKLTKKIQFIEAYDLGSSQAIVRSFNPDNAMPQVTSHFHTPSRSVAWDVWQSWYYFAHGNRGMIGWVQGWFDGSKPKPWLAKYQGTLKELGGVQGPKMVGARWKHDGIAIYYSQPSIQVSWCLDIEPHGRTWVNRHNDAGLGTSHLDRRAWEDMLTDAGLQYNFISYDQVVLHGIPDDYRVLVLPACYALSDIEAERIREFCRRGGTVIADFACGLFDQHGKGRAHGVLDDLFGVHHDGSESQADFFSGKLWVETDQDRGYNARSWRQLLATLNCPLRDGFAVAEKRLPTASTHRVGSGEAVYLNLSPERYLQYRAEGTATPQQRNVFLKYLPKAVKPWIRVTSNGARPRDCEVTYWKRGGRTLVFVVQRVALTGSTSGWSGTVIDKTIPVTIEFARPVQDVVDERTGKHLGAGRTFQLPFRTPEAVMLSLRDTP